MLAKPARLLGQFFLDTWRELDNGRQAGNPPGPRPNAAAGGGFDRQPMQVLTLGAACLLLIQYFGAPQKFFGFIDTMPWLWPDMYASPWRALAAMAWWGAWQALCFVILPVLMIRLRGGRVRDHGLALNGFASHWTIYLAAYLLILACIVAVSVGGSGFVAYYPMYVFAGRSWADLLAWEAIYLGTFFAVEFFFRGFWLEALRPALGAHAIFVSMVPYALIHVGKPLPEALGSIFFGIFLGTLAMKTRSIWGGCLIHVAVALSMDVAALIAGGRVPVRFWPTW